MGIAALVLGLLTSLGVIGSSFSQSFDIASFLSGVIGLLGSLLAPWRKAAAVILMGLAAVLLILIGYFTTNVNMLLSGILLHIWTILAAARKPRLA